MTQVSKVAYKGPRQCLEVDVHPGIAIRVPGAPHGNERDTGRLETIYTLVLERNLEQYDTVNTLLLDEASKDLALLKRC